MATVTKDREPNWDSFPPEIRRMIDKIRQHGSDALTDMERMLIAEIFRAATMTTEPRVMWVRKKIQEAHLEYCFRLPAIYRK